MIQFFSPSILVLFLFALMSEVAAYPVKSNQEINSEIQKIIDKNRIESDIAGMQVSIGFPNEALPRDFVSGTASITNRTPVKSDNLFQIGSLTKSYTAGILLQLEAEGLLSINDPISKYLSSIPLSWKNVTIKQLLNHTSGIYNFSESDDFLKIAKKSNFKKQWTPNELINIAINHKSYFKPGMGWHYSNTNYVLAGMIIHSITGKSVEDEMTNRLFGPLKLVNSYYLTHPYSKDILKRMVHGYSYLFSEKARDATDDNMSMADAAGAIVSTSHDTAIWLRKLLTTDAVIPAQQRMELMSLVDDKNGREIALNSKQSGYGLGIGREIDSFGNEIWLHDGETLGFTSKMFWLKCNDIVIAAVMNEGSQKAEIAGNLLKQDLVTYLLSLDGSTKCIKPDAANVVTGTQYSTPAGTTFILPQGWTASLKDNVLILKSADPDLKLALINLEAKDAASAVTAGWMAFMPDFHRSLHVSSLQSPRNGWDEIISFDYEVSPNEKQAIKASARRAGTNWLVVIQQSSQATDEKRRGQLNLIVSSLRPKGYQRESFTGKTAHAIDAKFIATMKTFVESSMKQLQIPGVAFSLIDEGKIVYEGGIGVRELNKPDLIDANTLFLAASNTKALTTLLLAKLVDENKLSWNEPVIDIYPAFKLGDAQTTQSVLLKHLVCACTGIPRRDSEWAFATINMTPEQATKILASLKPTSKFGEIFQYNNLMAAEAGYIAGSVAVPRKELGMAYDEAMQSKILEPLGMKDSTFDFAKAMRGNYARPHDIDIDGNLIVGQMDFNYTVIHIRPSGGLWTSVHDLSQYVLMELAEGKLPNGQRMVSEQNLMQRRVPNVVVSEDIDYGMGLMVDKRWGVTVIHHGGDLQGYHSDMMWLPDYNIGAVILTNSENGRPLRDAFLRKLLELLFDGKPEAENEIQAAAAQIKSERIQDRAQLQVPPDPAETLKLATRYHNDSLGTILVSRKGKDVIFTAGQWSSKVASRKNNDGTTSFITISPNVRGFEFVVGKRNQKPTLIIREAQHEYEFIGN